LLLVLVVEPVALVVLGVLVKDIIDNLVQLLEHLDLVVDQAVKILLVLLVVVLHQEHQDRVDLVV